MLTDWHQISLGETQMVDGVTVSFEVRVPHPDDQSFYGLTESQAWAVYNSAPKGRALIWKGHSWDVFIKGGE